MMGISCISADIGEWDDDNSLNRDDTMMKERNKLFPERKDRMKQIEDIMDFIEPDRYTADEKLKALEAEIENIKEWNIKIVSKKDTQIKELCEVLEDLLEDTFNYRVSAIMNDIIYYM